MATLLSILACRIPTDRGDWQAAVHGVTKSRTQLSNEAQHSAYMSIPVSQFPSFPLPAFPLGNHKLVLPVTFNPSTNSPSASSIMDLGFWPGGLPGMCRMACRGQRLSGGSLWRGECASVSTDRRGTH